MIDNIESYLKESKRERIRKYRKSRKLITEIKLIIMKIGMLGK